MSFAVERLRDFLMDVFKRENLMVFKILFRQSSIEGADGKELGLERLGLHSLHARLVTLLDNCDEEVHEDYVSKEHEEYIGQPSHHLILRFLNVKGALAPDYAQRHYHETEWAHTGAVLAWILE
jgi:hypothetical protein